MASNLGSYVVRVYQNATSTWANIPNVMIAYETYKVTPDQMIDLDSYVNEQGKLVRNVLEHTRSKIEFNTPYCNDAQWATVWDVIKGGFGWGGSAVNERKVRIQFYNPLTNTNDKATCYVPDIELTMRNVDFPNKIINYDPIRVAFIEY